MQTTVLMAALSLTLGAANAMAQTPQEQAAIVLPHAYSGYSQPEITKCQGNGPLSRECTVPAMTAGRYLIEAAAAADSTGANATQTLAIRLSGAPCVATNPAAFTGKQGLHVGCVVTLLTDQPIVVSAAYAVQNGTPDANGPQLAFHRLPWSGVVDSHPIVFKGRPKAAPAPAPAH